MEGGHQQWWLSSLSVYTNKEGKYLRYFIQISTIAIPLVIGLIGMILIVRDLPGVIASLPASYWIGMVLCLVCYIGLMMRAAVQKWVESTISEVHHFCEKTW